MAHKDESSVESLAEEIIKLLTSNEAADYLDEVKASMEAETVYFENQDDSNPEEALIAEEEQTLLLEKLLAALKALDENGYLVIYLKFYNDKSIDEIAGILGKTDSDISTIIDNTLKRLREAITK